MQENKVTFSIMNLLYPYLSLLKTVDANDCTWIKELENCFYESSNILFCLYVLFRYT